LTLGVAAVTASIVGRCCCDYTARPPVERGGLMTSRTQAFVLLLFGGALLRLATTDALLRYVRPVARPWVLLAGAAIVALALWSLFASRSGSGSGSDAHDAEVVDEHGHTGRPGRRGSCWPRSSPSWSWPHRRWARSRRSGCRSARSHHRRATFRP